MASGSLALTGSNPSVAAVSGDAPCWIRTNDRLLRRQLLYPAELREQGDLSGLGRGSRGRLSLPSRLQ